MGIALTQDQRDLADAVREFTARHAPRTRTREEFAALAEGKLPAAWDALKAQGFRPSTCPSPRAVTARWCLETGLAYVKVREQFGRRDRRAARSGPG